MILRVMVRCLLPISRPAVLLMEITNEADVLARCRWGGRCSDGGCMRFFGESMFSRERDASKVALVHLVAGLRKGRFTLLDTQYTTPHLTGLGGIGIPAADYQSLLHQALTVRAVWPDDFSLQALRESIASLRVPAGRPPAGDPP